MTVATTNVLSAQEAAIESGKKVLCGTVTDRVLRIFEAIRSYGPPRVALERAIYFTESFKTTEGQPLVWRWAKALKHIAENLSVAIRGVLAFIKHKDVVDYELLPYMRFGESKYGFLGRVYEMQDFNPPTPESLARLRAIIDEAFGRSGKPTRGDSQQWKNGPGNTMTHQSPRGRRPVSETC